MKIKTLSKFAIAIASLVFVAASCTKEEKETPAADELVGSYTGDLTISVFNQPSTDQATITVTKVDDSTVNLVLPAMGSGSMSLPSITVENIPAVKTTLDGEEVVKASVDTYSGTITVSGAEKSYQFSDLVILGSDENMAISWSLQYGKMPTAMICTFKAER